MNNKQSAPMPGVNPSGINPPAGAPKAAGSAVPAFKLRYGRLAIAMTGLVSLLTGLVSATMGIFGVGTGWLPAVALPGAAAAVLLLRRLAIRDRRRRMNAAFRDAMSAPARSTLPAARPGAAPAAGAGTTAPRETTLFDAQASPAAPKPGVKPGPKALTAQDLRAAALAEAIASGDTAAHEASAVTPAREDTSWEPVEVPKPTYVEAPKAERAAPGPLDLPEAPKAVGKPSLKQAARPPAIDLRAAGDAGEQPLGKAQSALSNLDDVLQRRRA